MQKRNSGLVNQIFFIDLLSFPNLIYYLSQIYSKLFFVNSLFICSTAKKTCHMSANDRQSHINNRTVLQCITQHPCSHSGPNQHRPHSAPCQEWPQSCPTLSQHSRPSKPCSDGSLSRPECSCRSPQDTPWARSRNANWIWQPRPIHSPHPAASSCSQRPGRTRPGAAGHLPGARRHRWRIAIQTKSQSPNTSGGATL